MMTTRLRKGLSALAVTGAAMLLAAQTAPSGPARAVEAKPTRTTAGAATYNVDSVHSTALFRVRHLGAGAFWGRFNGVTGSILHDPESETGLTLDVSIDIESVDTGSDNLNGHLKSPDFFDVAEFATMTFKSRKAKKSGRQSYEVTGDLTIHGVTKAITTSVDWLGTKAGAMGERCGFETTMTIKRSEFGIMYGIEQGALGDEIRIIVALEGIKQAEQAAGAGREGRGGGRGAGGNFMARLDTNGDGKIQKNELPERMQERFDELDANGDGALDADELSALRGRRGGRGGDGAGGRGGRGGGAGGASGGAGGAGGSGGGGAGGAGGAGGGGTGGSGGGR